MSTWYSILSRRKPLNAISQSPEENPSSSGQLARVLTTLDLTALGVGSTLGVGVYVLAGHVAKETAGPAVILSFLIAAIASVFAGLCYAEFGARVPKAGSAYVYSYVCVGEFIAFIIGWNLILEYVIGSASVAKGLSVYLDTLLNNTMRNAFMDIAPIDSEFMSEYFDFFSFGITIFLGGALAFGMKESSLANNIFTLINILVVVFVIIAGSIKANPQNWNIKNDTIPPEYNAGRGGFLPFGIQGVIKGAATCFYGFVGFDCIATTGEEVKNPKRAIPISIILSLFIIFLSYFGTSAVVTLMVPYYLQDPDAPLPYAFANVGWDWAKWIVSIGGICGLLASLFGAMFPLPRIIYAMANDALLFRFLGSVNSKYKTPVVGTILAAILTGLMSALFNLKQLVNMMSIGTLMAYTIVAACVIILRYTINDEEIANWKYSLLQPESDDEYSDIGHTYDTNDEYTENLQLVPPRQEITLRNILKTMFTCTKRNPDYITQKVVAILVFTFCVLSIILACLLSYMNEGLENNELSAIIPTSIIGGLLIMVLVAIYCQPTVQTTLSFKVPFVPLIPALSICINIYLMFMLDSNTWIRFGIWMIIGLPIYFACCYLYNATHTNTNGCANGIIQQNGYKQNGTTLTIPSIVVNPPSSENIRMEDPQEEIEEPVKEEHVRERTLSIDSNELENAVLEIDKVLDATENSFVDYEAVNPENEFKNVTVFNQNEETVEEDKTSICSSESSSTHSKEYHIEAQVHQEDQETSLDESPTIQTNVPVPPPLLPLLEEMKTISVLPPPKTKPPITVNSLQGVELRKTPKPRKRTISTNSDGPTDNVKAGSLQYNKIKSKLDDIFGQKLSLPIPEKRYYKEDKSPSPTIEKEDNVILLYDKEIPDDFGKTKEFKDKLNSLLLRRQSSNKNTKPEYVKKYEKNNENSSKIDEIKHKKLMADSLQSIRLRKTGLINDENEDKEQETKEENTTKPNIEKDKEKHKRLMIATLRNIKLRKTGLNLNDEPLE